MSNRPTVSAARLLGAMAALLAAVFFATAASAQTTLSNEQKDRELAELKQQLKALESRINNLENLDQRVRTIDRKLEVQQETELAKAREAPQIKAGAQGFLISSAQPDDWSIRFGGIIQADGRFFTSGDDKTGSTFYLNRVRPIISGVLWKYYEFNITPDFGQGKVVLQDAYINDTYFDLVNFQAGKYKTPYSLERLQSDRDLPFSERSEANNLEPNRDIGAELHADLFDQRLTYQIAFMNGVPNNTASTDTDINDGKDFIGRLFFTPFIKGEREWLRGLGVGFAATYGDESNATISTYKTYGQSTWFSYNKNVTASGPRFRYQPQLYYYWGPLGVLASFDSDQHALNLNGLIPKGGFPHYVNKYKTFTDTGYMATASWVLTGENAGYKGVKPYHPFDPRNGHWGAFELAGRISNVGVDSDVFKTGFANPNLSASTATEYAVGLNWYLSQNVKWQFDYARTFFDGGAGTVPQTPQDRPDESVFETQLQLAF